MSWKAETAGVKPLQILKMQLFVGNSEPVGKVGRHYPIINFYRLTYNTCIAI